MWSQVKRPRWLREYSYGTSTRVRPAPAGRARFTIRAPIICEDHGYIGVMIVGSSSGSVTMELVTPTQISYPSGEQVASSGNSFMDATVAVSNPTRVRI